MSARQRKAKGQRRKQHSAAARHKTAARRAAIASGTLTGVLATSLTLGIAGPELATASAATLSAAEVKDINSVPAGGKPSQITDVGGTVFFTAFDPTHGRELWKSDGTTGGTTLVKDIDSGDQGSYPSSLTDVGGTLYFVANDGAHGYELWKSDGTADGTVLVKDISDGNSSSYPANLRNANGTLFFSANDGSSGNELWRSDGTEVGTLQVKDIRSGPAGSNPADLTNVNGTVFFSANDGSSGYELWKSDGTAAGTVLVKDIDPGGASGIGYYYGGGDLTNVNGTLFFAANDGTTGQELWKSDGTTAGTVLVKDIRSGSAYSNPANLTNVGGTLFFTANDGTTGTELWTSDGTGAGTVLVKDINTGTQYGYGVGSNPAGLTNVGGTLFFSANDGTSGNELWKSDGTGAGTVLVKAITPTTNGYPTNLTNVNGTLFFVANDGTTGRELWTSDGTEGGTVQVKDIDPGAASGVGYYGGGDLTDVGGTLFLVASDGATGQQLWKSDGTEGGTVAVSTIDGGDLASNPHSFADVNGTLFFAANDGSGTELWKTDGSDAGTVLVKDINTGTTYDGYPAGSYPSNLTKVNGTLFFDANDGTNGYELWKSNGTEAGTVLVKDINPGTYNSNPLSGFPNELTNVNGTLFFTANNGTSGTELWKSNGTGAGTVLVKDVDPGGGSSIGYYGGELTNANGTLFFRATDGTTGYELWKSDGTAAGTLLVKDIFSGSGSGYPYGLTNVNGTVFFNANDGTTGRELWSSDGTAAGTLLIKDINPKKYGPYAAGSYPFNFTDVNGTVFFSATDGTNGLELWKTDGTAAGTLLVKDINPGTYGNGYAASSDPSSLTNVNGTLFFTALDASSGRELWASNGVAAGTVLVKDIRPGSGSSFGYYSSGLFNENGTVFFGANDGATGNELWSATGSGAPLDPTSTGVSCAPSSVTTGQETTCTVTVTDTASSGATTPTGTVSFSAAPSSGSFGNTSCDLSSSGPNTASCDVTFTPTAAGDYTISGTYLGDAGHNTSHGADSLSAAIPVDPTTTAANCSPASVTTGDPATCTVTVTDLASSGANAPTGTVSFSAAPSSGSFGNTSCDLSSSGPNTATCDVTFTPTAKGGYTITGTYGGDPGHTTSEGNASLTATTGSGTASVGKIKISGTSAKVKIKCKGTTGQTCAMGLTMSVTETLRGSKVIRVTAATTKKKTIVVGKAKKTIPAGKTVTVKVSLNSKAKRLLRKFHKLHVKLVVREQTKTIKTKKLTFKSKKH